MTKPLRSSVVSGVSPARAAAASVLVRVWNDDAFASAALDIALTHAGLSGRDAALATELVYGVLRTQAYLEGRIAALASRRSWTQESLVYAHILVAAYSIAFLDRVPVFAAVSEAVSGARATGGERVASFTNAVLRGVANEVASKRPSLEEAIAASAPGWLRGALRRSLGRAGAAAYLAAGPVPPPLGLCVARAEERNAWIDVLQRAAHGATVEAGTMSPRAILVRGAGDVRRLPGAGEAWIVQEEGAQVMALAAGATPGERILDACAGHGNKAWLLAHQVGPTGRVDAADRGVQKLEQLRAGPPGTHVQATYPVDWTEGSGNVPEGYDRVVVDAPCSGVGTLRRRPEIGHHRTADDVARLATLQAAIVRRAATRARHGGKLLFAVCSVLREEGEQVIAALLEGEALGVRLEAAPFDNETAQHLADEGHTLRLVPHVHGTDGYFAASFVVRHIGR